MKKWIFVLLLGISLPCWAIECSSNKPLIITKTICSDPGRCQEIEECRDCSFLGPAKAIKENCIQCDREYVDGWCLPKKCPKGYFMSKFIECLPCDEKENIWASAEHCTHCPNRKYFHEKCILGCPNGQFLGQDGVCYSCFSKDGIKSSDNEECRKCANRIEENGICILRDGPKVLPKKNEQSSIGISKRVVINPDKNQNYSFCGSVQPSKPCLFYVQNYKTYDMLGDDFLKEVASKINRGIFEIQKSNPSYQKMLVKPGYFAEIIVPALR